MQARTDGFTYSRLPQYQNWADLRDSARADWNVYRSIAKPRAVTRIGVRFINRIELHHPSDFDDYFVTFPRLAPQLPQILAGMFMRIVVPFESAAASITAAIDTRKVTPDIVPVIFDIDVFSTLEAGDDDAVWAKVEELRTIKNRVFFESTTEKLRGAYT